MTCCFWSKATQSVWDCAGTQPEGENTPWAYESCPFSKRARDAAQDAAHLSNTSSCSHLCFNLASSAFDPGYQDYVALLPGFSFPWKEAPGKEKICILLLYVWQDGMWEVFCKDFQSSWSARFQFLGLWEFSFQQSSLCNCLHHSEAFLPLCL